MNFSRLTQYYFLGVLLVFMGMIASPAMAQKRANATFNISFTKDAYSKPITGRVILVLSKQKQPEPRYQAGSYFLSAPFWGKDVSRLKPGEPTVIDTTELGYPVDNLRDLPAGDYYLQAVMNVYTHFNRADGHEVWLPMDHWEGQHFNRSPGNLISSVKQIHYDPSKEQNFSATLDKVLPDIKLPEDTKQVKHIKIKSDLLSNFWGHPMYLGATILLPKGYDSLIPIQHTRWYTNRDILVCGPRLDFQQKNAKCRTRSGHSWIITIARRVTNFRRLITVRIFHG